MQSDRSLDVRTNDAHEVREIMAGLLGPFELTAQSESYDARLRHDRLGQVSFSSVAYGNEVQIRARNRANDLILHWPLTGSFEARLPRRQVTISSRTAHFIRPDVPFGVRSSPDCCFLIMSVDLTYLANHARALLDGDPPQVLPDTMALTGQGAGLARYMAFLYAESTRADGLLHVRAASNAAEQMLLASLVLAVSGDSRSRPADLAYVKRAEEFMLANLGERIGISDVVANAGTGIRSLYQAFHVRHGVGPMSWLRQRRLERVRAELTSADPSAVNVSAIAMRWGFAHLGRFASYYRTQFGESPSQTLHRR